MIKNIKTEMESIKKLFIDLFIWKTCMWAKKKMMTTCENFFLLLMPCSHIIYMWINRKCKTKQNKTVEELSWSAISVAECEIIFFIMYVYKYGLTLWLFVYIVDIQKKNVGQIEFFSPLSSRSRFLFLLLIFCCHRQCSRNRFKYFFSTFSILDIKIRQH